jgi:hypothetical protein
MDPSVILFPFADYWWFYAGFTLFVLGMLALDLGVFHRESHEVKFKEALIWSIVWVSLATGLLLWFLAICPMEASPRSPPARRRSHRGPSYNLSQPNRP